MQFVQGATEYTPFQEVILEITKKILVCHPNFSINVSTQTANVNFFYFVTLAWGLTYAAFVIELTSTAALVKREKRE